MNKLALSLGLALAAVVGLAVDANVVLAKSGKGGPSFSTPKTFTPANGSNISANFANKGTSPKTTFTTSSMKTFTKNGKQFNFKCFPSNYWGWSHHCWSSYYRCYCYYCPTDYCWYYYCASEGCYLPLESTTIFPPAVDDDD